VQSLGVTFIDPRGYSATMTQIDFLVVGAGIAGASIAAHLAETHKVVLIDMEERVGYHTTSRSAASYEPNYGPPPMLAFTRASDYFFKNPPIGFADTALLTPRASLFFEAEGQAEHTAKLLAHASDLAEINFAQAQKQFPVLRPDYATRCFLDAHTADIDVDLLHSGYLKMFKARGGTMLLSSPLSNAQRKAGAWTVQCGATELVATTIINASGAWGDVVANICSAKPAGLIPKRRSIGVVPLAEGLDFKDWPMVTDVGETWYAKPQSGKLIVSSADATPVEPHDAYADDMAVAEGVDRLMTATTIEVERMEHSWGGLRTFATDGNPVIGFDPHTDGFFWLVGQGGYGIQSCPALSTTAAAMAQHHPIPEDVIALGLDPDDIKPDRFHHD
jgi:D-arginine dehydrogenase